MARQFLDIDEDVLLETFVPILAKVSPSTLKNFALCSRFCHRVAFLSGFLTSLKLSLCPLTLPSFRNFVNVQRPRGFCYLKELTVTTRLNAYPANHALSPIASIRKLTLTIVLNRNHSLTSVLNSLYRMVPNTTSLVIDIGIHDLNLPANLTANGYVVFPFWAAGLTNAPWNLSRLSLTYRSNYMAFMPTILHSIVGRTNNLQHLAIETQNFGMPDQLNFFTQHGASLKSFHQKGSDAMPYGQYLAHMTGLKEMNIIDFRPNNALVNGVLVSGPTTLEKVVIRTTLGVGCKAVGPSPSVTDATILVTPESAFDRMFIEKRFTDEIALTFPGLKRLSIEFIPDPDNPDVDGVRDEFAALTDRALASVLEALPQLEELKLRRTRAFSGVFVAAVFMQVKDHKLKKLSIIKCPDCMNRTLSGIVRKHGIELVLVR